MENVVGENKSSENKSNSSENKIKSLQVTTKNQMIQVYKNTLEYYKRRDINIINEISDIISNDEEILKRSEYNKKHLIIYGMKNNIIIMSIIFDENSNDIARGADFESFINSKYTISKKYSLVSQINIITKYEINKNIKRAILNIHNLFKRNTTIHNILWSTFTIVVPDHEAVPKHSIMTAEESKAFFDMYRCNRGDLQKIHLSDPAIIWLGANVGDIIKIDRLSENTGISIGYRVVINK